MKNILFLLLFIGSTGISVAQFITGPQVVCTNDYSTYDFVQVSTPLCDTAKNCTYIWEVWNSTSVGNPPALFTQTQQLSNATPYPWKATIGWGAVYYSGNTSGNPRSFTITMRKTGCLPSGCNTLRNRFKSITGGIFHKRFNII